MSLQETITNFNTEIFAGIINPQTWFENNLGSINDILFLSENCSADKTSIAFFQAFDIYLKEKKLEDVYQFTSFKIKERLCTLSLKQENIESHINVDLRYGFNFLYPDILILDWLLICLKSSSDVKTKFYFDKFSFNSDPKLIIDPEEHIKTILFNDSGVLKKIFRNDWKIYIQDLVHWYLNRYDFQTAKDIIKGKKKDTNKFQIIGNCFLSWLPLAILIIPFIWKGLTIDSFNFFTFLPFTFSKGVFKMEEIGMNDPIYSIYNTPIVFFEAFFILFILFYLFCRIKKNSLYINLITPRLLIGILVGYFTLFAGSTYWDFSILSFSSSAPQNIFIPLFISLVLLWIVYLFLRYEVRRAIGEMNKQKIAIRAVVFFRKCVWSSFFIGILLLDVFFIIYLKNVERTFDVVKFVNRFHTGIIGVIDPILLLLFFPLALIFGVVIRFLIEEKPITHPLK